MDAAMTPATWVKAAKKNAGWYIDHAWILYPMGDVVGGFLATFKEFPPRMKAGSFTIGDALEKLEPAAH